MYQPKRNRLKSKYKVDYGRSKKRVAVTIISFLICLFGASFFSSSSISGQNASNKLDYPIKHDNHSEDRIPFRVMSWNVENLFDTHHDSLKNDEEFLPKALRHWNYTRYKKKLDDIARVIVAVGEWNPPALVGLCEVENDTVLRDLTRRSPLKNLDFRYVMTNSPDQRGIDVALLYQRDLFKLLSYRSISIPSFKQHRPTRDLLHVSGLLLTGDTLDVFVCHLPSRSGGAKESEPYRLFAAQKLRTEVDSLLKGRFHPQLIIMGDFNDYPTNKSINKILEAEAPPATSEVSPLKLYHLLARKAKSRDFGSYKYRGEWGCSTISLCLALCSMPPRTSSPMKKKQTSFNLHFYSLMMKNTVIKNLFVPIKG